MAEPDRDDADVIERLLMRVYEIHERVIARGGGRASGIPYVSLLQFFSFEPQRGCIDCRNTLTLPIRDFSEHSRVFHAASL